MRVSPTLLLKPLLVCPKTRFPEVESTPSLRPCRDNLSGTPQCCLLLAAVSFGRPAVNRLSSEGWSYVAHAEMPVHVFVVRHRRGVQLAGGAGGGAAAGQDGQGHRGAYRPWCTA